MINNLCDQAEREGLAVACDFLAHQEQSAMAMLGAAIPKDIRQRFQKRFSDWGLRLPEMVGMLMAAILLLSSTLICIDALDKCVKIMKRNEQQLKEKCIKK